MQGHPLECGRTLPVAVPLNNSPPNASEAISCQYLLSWAWGLGSPSAFMLGCAGCHGCRELTSGPVISRPHCFSWFFLSTLAPNPTMVSDPWRSGEGIIIALPFIAASLRVCRFLGEAFFYLSVFTSSSFSNKSLKNPLLLHRDHLRTCPY